MDAPFIGKSPKKPLPKWFPLAIKLSYLGVIALALVDIIVYNGVVQNHLKFSPLMLGAVAAVIHLLIRLTHHYHLPKSFAKVSLSFVAPVLGILPALLFCLEEYGPMFPNYFFVNFKFHYAGLFPLTLIIIMFGLSHAPANWLKKRLKIIYFYGLLGILLWAGYLHLQNPQLFKTIRAEDGLIENLTALGYFASAGLSVWLSRYAEKWGTKKWEKYLFQYLFLLAGIAFFVVGGEEISWGQRIFEFQTPAIIAEQNRQSEINLHNSEIVWPYVYTGYLLIGLYGMLAWIPKWLATELLPKKGIIANRVKLFIPSGYLFINFAMIVLYVWLRRNHGPWKYVAWEELAELYLVGGIMIHLVQQVRLAEADCRQTLNTLRRNVFGRFK